MGESLLALILVVVVVLAFISYGPKIWELIKTAVGFSKFDTNNIDTEKTVTQIQREVKGELGVFTVKMEDQLANQKPTSPDHCLVGTFMRNTGKETWLESAKIRVTLFCKHTKNQLKEIFIENYPVFQDYIIGLKPGEQKEVLFAGRFPNN